MIHLDIILSIFIVFLLSSIILYVFTRLNISFIVSLLTSGVILGQLGIIKSNEIFSTMSDLGLVLLLFFIGVEFSVSTLLREKEDIVIGIAQVVLTFLLFYLVTFLVFKSHILAFLIGATLTFSSTIVVGSVIEKSGSFGLRYARIAFITSLIQDIFSIIVLTILPFFLEGEIKVYNLIIGIILFIVYNFLLYYFTKTRFADVLAVRDRYLLVFLAIVVSFGSATISKFLGLSPFLGAFVAGMIIADSLFGRQVASEIFSLKEIFIGFFFIYVGALINLQVLISKFLIVLLLTVFVIIVKILVVFLINMFSKVPISHNLKSSILLSNIGEFGFLILSLSLNKNVINNELFSVISTSIVLSMVLTPILMELMKIIDKKLLGKIKGREKSQEELLVDVIIVGFGPVGQEVSRVLNELKVNHVILETNINTVRKFRKKGIKIHFGDAKNEHILKWAGVSSAKIIIITVPDINETTFVLEKAKTLNENIKVIARAKFLTEVEKLKSKGIERVICDESETAKSITIDLLEELQMINEKSREIIREEIET
jgi:CPA2 family monovalent cation:H+ antiporter-2